LTTDFSKFEGKNQSSNSSVNFKNFKKIKKFSSGTLKINGIFNNISNKKDDEK
jgi:hypothetical protein